MNRDETLAAIVEQSGGLTPSHPVRVAVDGIDAAGKTTLANDLAPLLRARSRA